MNIGLLLNVNKHSNKLYGKTITQVAEGYHRTKTEVDILLFLSRHPQYDTAREIVEIRGITKSYVSKAVDSLVKAGLLETVSDQEDRRISHLRILPAAEEIVRRARKAQEAYFETVMKGITQEEQNLLEDILGRILENIAKAGERD